MRRIYIIVSITVAVVIVAVVAVVLMISQSGNWRFSIGSRNQSFLNRQMQMTVNYQDPYADCTGHSFTGTCQDDGKCIDNDIERRVYDLWKEDFIERQNMTVTIFNQYVEVSDVILQESPTKTFVSIQAIYLNGWARSRNTESIQISGTNSAQLTDEQIRQAIDFNHSPSAKHWEVVHTEPVISIDRVKDIVDEKYNGTELTPKFCAISSNDEGMLLVMTGMINQVKNTCVSGQLNLLTGEISYQTNVCYIE